MSILGVYFSKKFFYHVGMEASAAELQRDEHKLSYAVPRIFDRIVLPLNNALRIRERGRPVFHDALTIDEHLPTAQREKAGSYISLLKQFTEKDGNPQQYLQALSPKDMEVLLAAVEDRELQTELLPEHFFAGLSPEAFEAAQSRYSQAVAHYDQKGILLTPLVATT